MGVRTFVAGLACALITASAAHAAVPLDPRWRLVGPFRGGWGEMVVGIPERPDSFMFGAAGGRRLAQRQRGPDLDLDVRSRPDRAHRGHRHRAV